MPKVGAVTIGQSPRADVVPELEAVLGPGFEFEERGALDGLTPQEIAAMAPEAGDYVLVTRLADGRSVMVSKRQVLPRLQGCLEDLDAAGVDLIVLLCTGEFPALSARRILLEPEPILHKVTAALAAGRRLGVLVPSAEQVPQSEVRWHTVAAAVRCVGASPYVDAEAAVARAACELAEWGAELVVMDCVGYTVAMKEAVRSRVRCPVVLARTLIARVVAELAG